MSKLFDILRKGSPQLTPMVRILVLLACYITIGVAAWWLSYLVRFDFNIPREFKDQAKMLVFVKVPLSLASLYLFGQFSGLLSYFSIPDLQRLFLACCASSAGILAVRLTGKQIYAVPRGVILVNLLLVFTGFSMLRLCFRLYRERLSAANNRPHRRVRRVGIIGAGDVGASLAKELAIKRGLGMQPVAFFDDDRRKWRSRIHDIPVVGGPEDLLDQNLNLQLDEIIIAMPSAPAKRIGEVVQLLQKARLKFETVPSLDQLATGQVKVSQLREVQIQDLLGREPVKIDMENIRDILKGRVVMVTGAGGSIGGELCRQIAGFHPQRLLLVDQSEVQIFPIEQELVDLGHRGVIVPLVADILDEPRMRFIFDRFGPAVIFHAAAHKHVPMMESQPSEAIKNNTFGTVRMAELALEFNVDRFVLISTDKAINPTNVMGASKRLAEMFLQAFHAQNPARTKFMAVRFGNVLGSSGSVIPIFKKQIAAGGPVKVTHPEVTRYFMTIPEAASLVLQSAAQGSGGEIFVLDMGKPVRIVDLARQLIELTGLRPDEDIEIEFIGLRPGEKLFEELSHKGENIAETHHPKIMRFVCQPQPVELVRAHLETLKLHVHQSEPSQLKMLLKNAVPEYIPYLT